MAEIAMKVAQSVAENVAGQAQKGPAVGGSMDFSKIMDSLGMSPQNQGIKAISAEGLDINPKDITAKTEIRSHGKALDLLSEANRGVLQMNHIIEMTMQPGKQFTPQELLSLQASVHEIALTTDLTSKIMEQTTQSTKTLFQTNFA